MILQEESSRLIDCHIGAGLHDQLQLLEVRQSTFREMMEL
jgi:hypothetical protein